MKNLKLLVFGLLLSNLSYGQIVKIQAGPSFSVLDWRTDNMPIIPYDDVLIGYSVTAGIDYLDSKYFNLSSNLGLIRKGGKELVTYMNSSGEPIGEGIDRAKLDYFTVNTTIDIKLPVNDKLIPFISIGPRFDYLIKHSIDFQGVNEMGELNKYNVGLIFGGGMKYDLSKFQIGLRADYYMNFIKVAEWPAQGDNSWGEIDDRTFSLNLIVGYKL